MLILSQELSRFRTKLSNICCYKVYYTCAHHMGWILEFGISDIQEPNNMVHYRSTFFHVCMVELHVNVLCKGIHHTRTCICVHYGVLI